MTCPNCGSDKTAEVYKSTYGHDGKVYCYQCKRYFVVSKKKWNPNHKIIKPPYSEEIKKKNKAAWTPEMDAVLDRALKSGELFDFIEGKEIITGPEFNRRD